MVKWTNEDNLHVFVCLKEPSFIILIVYLANYSGNIKYLQSLVKKNWTIQKQHFAHFARFYFMLDKMD